MEQDRKPAAVPPERETGQAPEQGEKKPYSRKARALAWVGVAFMVFLTIMYFYVFFSGKVLGW